MSKQTFIQFLLFFIALFEPYTCAILAPKPNREQPAVGTLNLEASQLDDRFLLDKFEKYKQLNKLDKLEANEQSANSVFVPFELNENIEESTKNVVLWTPENCKFTFQVYISS